MVNGMIFFRYNLLTVLTTNPIIVKSFSFGKGSVNDERQAEFAAISEPTRVSQAEPLHRIKHKSGGKSSSEQLRKKAAFCN